MKKLLTAAVVLMSAFCFAQTQVGGVLVQEVVTVAFSSTPTFNARNANVFKLTLTGNVTSSSLTNAEPGQEIVFEICQDGTGGRTFVPPTNVIGFVTIPSAASACILETFVYDGTNAVPTVNWAAPGTIGSSTPNTGKFTTVTIPTNSNTLPATITNDTTGGLNLSNNAGNTWQLNSSGTWVGPPGKVLSLGGATSGATLIQSAAIASGTLTLPAATGTIACTTCAQTLSATTLSNPAIVNATSTGTDNGTETLQNKTLTGANSGNNTNLLNQQNAGSPITGTGAAATVYTYSLPANTVALGKSFHLRTMANHNSGTASVTYTLTLNGATLVTFADTTVGSHVIDMDVFNTGAATGSTMELFGPSSVPAGSTVASGLAWASGQTLLLTFTVANTDQVTGQGWKVTLDQ